MEKYSIFLPIGKRHLGISKALPYIGILTIAAVSIVAMSNKKPAEVTPKLKVAYTHATTETETEITFDNSDVIPIATPMTPEDIAEEDFLGECEYAAAMVEAEAGNQDLLGKMYVAQVLYNRVYNSGKFPNSITENIEMLHQFTTYENGRIEEAQYHISDESFEAVRRIFIDGETLDANILFFSAEGYNGTTPAYKVGGALFQLLGRKLC